MNEERGLRGHRLKNALRRRVVSELPEEPEQRKKGISLEQIQFGLRWVVGILLALALFLGYRGIRGNLQYSSFSVVWENEELGSSSALYQEFDGYILRITMDGVACLDTAGEVKWNYGFSMKSPAVQVQGSYGVIADIQANSAVVFNNAGVTGEITTTLPILNATVSGHGVTALVLNDTGVNYVTFYDNTGNVLDIKIKTKLSGDGYPLDLSLSPKGTGLINSVVYLDQTQMQNQIVFYNFDVGQTDSNRMVGYYGYGTSMFPEVAYLSDTVAVGFGDDQLNLYSLKNESHPTEIKSIELEGDVFSILYNSEYVGVILQTEDTNRMLRVYDTSGKLKFEKAIEFDYTTAKFSNGNIAIYNNTECMILNDSGRVRYRGTVDGNIQGLVCIGDNGCIVMNGASMRRLRFH